MASDRVAPRRPRAWPKGRALGRAAVAVAVDTADAGDVDRLSDTTAGRLGPVTGLVNDAG